MQWKVPVIWKGADCYIIGGGPSLPRQFSIPEDVIKEVVTGAKSAEVYSPYLSALHDKHIIGVNNAYLLGSWVDVLLFGDKAWYLQHGKDLANWPGLKVSCAPALLTNQAGIKYLKRESHGLAIGKRIKVGWNSNSGAAAISLAVHFGAKRIILLGFDMQLDNNNVSHWHGKHNPKNFEKHLKGFAQIAQEAEEHGIEILNANLDSAIEDFEKVHISDILAGVPVPC